MYSRDTRADHGCDCEECRCVKCATRGCSAPYAEGSIYCEACQSEREREKDAQECIASGFTCRCGELVKREGEQCPECAANREAWIDRVAGGG
jgi:hypothetical protein